MFQALKAAFEGSEPSAVCEVGVLLGLQSVMPVASTTFLIRPGWVNVSSASCET